MADEKYIIPENPDYQAEDIRKLQDNDPASASGTFNPLVQKILESIAHNKKHKAELSADGKVLKDQLPQMNSADLGDKDQPGGFASLDDTGKVPSEQLPEMDYIPMSEKETPKGVPILGEDGKIPAEFITNEGGLVAQNTAPENQKLGWIDTENGNILKFHDGESWIPVGAVWG